MRTDRDELGVVIRATPGEPLHPIVALVGNQYDRVPGEVDTSLRDPAGQYVRHIVETICPLDGLDDAGVLAAAVAV